MNRILKVLNVILGLLAILIIFGLGYQTGQRYDIAVDENDKYVAISYSVNEQKMRRLMSLIDNQYIENINTDSLVDNTINFVMSNLDPHSVYLEKKLSRDMEREMKGYYVGIGIQYVIYNDTMIITHVDKQSPNKSFFKLSDRVLSVNDSVVTGKAVSRAADLIQGEINSDVQIKIIRDGEKRTINARRSVIPRASVSESYMLTNQLGYIKLRRFGENTYLEFKTALLKLKHQGMNALVLDLRGNPGGLMSSAERIADEFLGSDQLIVFTQDADGKKAYRYATNKGEFDGQQLYVLIDEGSASASEIIAGAVQDNDAGTIIGRRSYGKGLVQREISLGDGSKLRLTTAKYYTPTGRSIQKPYSNGIEQYNSDITKRYLSGEMFTKDSIKIPDSLMFKTPKGKIVYGGGGIIPDVFIPIDSMGYGRWFYEQTHNDLFNIQIFNHIEKNHESLQKILEEHFISYYKTDELALKMLTDIGLSPEQLDEKEMINFNNFIKAGMARFLYGQTAYDKVWSRNDPMILKAIELNNSGK
ncbi:MAG: S41 family peptidase [Flavobacteriaceae bacterium]|nr:S41 family peptidase [Flavobacteriaceae bacterium]